jgi:hypothetical protein
MRAVISPACGQVARSASHALYTNSYIVILTLVRPICETGTSDRCAGHARHSAAFGLARDAAPSLWRVCLDFLKR